MIAGKYAFAMASVMQDNLVADVSMNVYCRNPDKAKEINETRQLKETTALITLKEGTHATTSVAECVKGADFIFLCIPAQTISKFLNENRDHFEPQSIFVNCAKGMAIVEKMFIS